MGYPRIQSAEKWAVDLNFAGLESQYGLPAGVMTKLVRQESHGDCSITNKKSGATGLCQWIPKYAAAVGVDPTDPASSAKGAAKYLAQLMDANGGDIDKALAAYNWGPGNMRKLLREHPTDWRNYLPAETKDYLVKVGSGLGKSLGQRIADGDPTVTEEERRAEELRRRRELEESGYKGPAMGLSDLFGPMFAAILTMLLKPMLDKMDMEPAPAPVAPDRVAAVDPRVETPRVPTIKTPAKIAAPALG